MIFMNKIAIRIAAAALILCVLLCACTTDGPKDNSSAEPASVQGTEGSSADFSAEPSEEPTEEPSEEPTEEPSEESSEEPPEESSDIPQGIKDLLGSVYGSFGEMGFTAVEGMKNVYTCGAFSGKKALVLTDADGAYINTCFIFDNEYTDPGLDYSHRVYGGRAFTRGGDGTYSEKRRYAVVSETGEHHRFIDDEPEVLGKLVIVDYKDVHGLGEGEGNSVISPCSKLDTVGSYGEQVLLREGSGYAVCFGEPLAPMPDWPQWRVYDSEGNIRTLPVEDEKRWDVARVEFDKSSSDPDAVIVTFKNGNTFKANLRDTRAVEGDEAITYYYLYEYSRRDSIPEIIYTGVIDPDSKLDGKKRIMLFPDESSYPVFTIKREYKQINVGYAVPKGPLNMYVADLIINENGVKRVVPDCILVRFNYGSNGYSFNKRADMIPLAGMLRSETDLYNIDVFGRVYTYYRGYSEDGVYRSEEHVFFVPEAEHKLRHIVCGYAQKSGDGKYLVLSLSEEGTRTPYMIVDSMGSIRSLPVPDDRIGDVKSVWSAHFDDDDEGHEEGDIIVTLNTVDGGTETVKAKLSDTRVLTGEEADEYYYVNGSLREIFNYELNGNGGYNLTIKANFGIRVPEELVLPAYHNGLPVNRVNVIGKNIKKISIPDTVISLALTHCFELTGIRLPDSLEELKDGAFDGCSKITELNIPAHLRYIGEDAFRGMSSLEKITMDHENAYYACAGNCLIDKKTKTLILGCKNSVIPSDGSVTNIGDRAFCSCDGLTTLTIPEGVVSIGESAFAYCASLEKVYVPHSVTGLDAEAFKESPGLSVYYNGTVEEWQRLAPDWFFTNPAQTAHCTDGDVTAPQWFGDR